MTTTAALACFQLDQGLILAGCELLRQRRWLVLRAPCEEPLSQPMGRPGLWRVVEDRTLDWARVFELPSRCVADQSDGDADAEFSDASDDGSEATPLSAALAWAAATAEGCVAPEWQPPAREALEAWLPSHQLVARAGACAAQGAVLSAAGVLRLSLPLTTRPVHALSPSRRAWVSACLADTESRLRLVRLGVRPDDDALVAEVDLSGAPAALVARLLPAAAAALRAAGERLLPTLSILFDTGSSVTLLDQDPERAQPAERSDA